MKKQGNMTPPKILNSSISICKDTENVEMPEKRFRIKL
jgi:hypothetical protein